MAAPPRSSTARQVADHWARVARREEIGFWNVPGWVRHQNLLASGDPERSWLDVFLDDLAAIGWRAERVLSLGSGGGGYERTLIERGLCSSVEACDLSPHLVQAAQRRAERAGMPIRYFVADLNTPDFPPQTFDLVFAAAIFHHVEQLETLFDNLRRSLTERGRLIVFDYVGPSRFQWRAAQIAVCNEWLRELPTRLRRKRGYPPRYVVAKRLFDLLPGVHSRPVERLLRLLLPSALLAQFLRLRQARLRVDEIVPPPVEQFQVTDPSEAIRSDEIPKLLADYFVIERSLRLGGTLAQPLFGGTAANFIHDPEGPVWAERILDHERELVSAGTLSSDFVALVARPRGV